tara:strand:- start:264 stop:713 length:450 start_codon:yes stop_codon:yes gene_type:complete
MHTIVLIEPKIPQNTGTIARLCAATNTKLILVGTLGFSLEDKYLKRAGLDYWEHVQWEHQPDLNHFLMSAKNTKPYLLTSKTLKKYTDVQFLQNQTFFFGSETEGLSENIKHQFNDRLITIPMENPNIRSLNLANSVSIVLYEAIRQNS